MPRITVELITNKEFSIENRGYNRREVDTFLDEISEELEHLDAELQELRQKTVTPKAQEPAAGPSAQEESSFREILEMAQKVKEETIRRAKEDAEAIRAKAETEAAERLNGLSEERSAAEKEIAGLKEVAAEYRRQFEALLQAQQEALEKATDLF
ncbi:MAG: DivIVA domain-containing protein [Clostridiales bacterium]|nr:DivIVA domain-containing protein [Clostridiales bacterium]